MLRQWLLVMVLLFPLYSIAQHNTSDSTKVIKTKKKKKKKKTKDPYAPKKWALNGYVKQMSSLLFINDPMLSFIYPNKMMQDNLLHNRINFSWYISDAFTFKTDLRTRIFYGEVVRSIPNYGDLVDNANNDFFDLSWVVLNEKAAVIHTMIDRLYLDFAKGNWQVRLGRQRINWGINTMWNPHDIFNAYNFTDFDYAERPGSDALRVQYYTGVASSIELAVKVFDKWEEATAGLLWKFNKWNYDFQALAGITNNDLVGGLGWAGNLGTAGFKGEMSYFYSLGDSVATRHSFAASLGFDYIFSNGVYLNGGLLYNSNGIVNGSISQLFTFELSAKNLYPYKYSMVLAAGHAFTPLISGNLSVVYSPGESHAVFISPTITYSIKENWDIDLIGQITLNKSGNKYISPMQFIFLRLKWSF
ncbi:MAG: hypothetical protein GY810_14515 [Aureispira sp.]|nr:hypothetical protein [Aureispira sp.]